MSLHFWEWCGFNLIANLACQCRISGYILSSLSLMNVSRDLLSLLSQKVQEKIFVAEKLPVPLTVDVDRRIVLMSIEIDFMQLYMYNNFNQQLYSFRLVRVPYNLQGQRAMRLDSHLKKNIVKKIVKIFPLSVHHNSHNNFSISFFFCHHLSIQTSNDL